MSDFLPKALYRPAVVVLQQLWGPESAHDIKNKQNKTTTKNYG